MAARVHSLSRDATLIGLLQGAVSRKTRQVAPSRALLSVAFPPKLSGYELHSGTIGSLSRGWNGIDRRLPT